MAKKLALITGGNNGLGFHVVKQLLATSNYNVIIASRDLSRGNTAADTLRKQLNVTDEALQVLKCDLADFASVRDFASTVRSRCPKLDLLICNAALIPAKFSRTVDGNEVAFQTCHLGHFMLTLSLLPLLQAAEKPRVVVVSSELHRKPVETVSAFHLQNLNETSPFKPMEVYSIAKLYNLWFVSQLAKKFPNIEVVGVSPGWVPTTDLGRFSSWAAQLVMKNVMSLLPMTVSVQEGAARIVDACINPQCQSGQYWSRRTLTEGSPASQDSSKAEELWNLSLKLTEIEDVAAPSPLS